MTLPLISASDAAYYTGRPVGTIWRWASEGRITSYGGRYNVRELPGKTIDEAGEGHLRAPPPTPPPTPPPPRPQCRSTHPARPELPRWRWPWSTGTCAACLPTHSLQSITAEPASGSKTVPRGTARPWPTWHCECSRRSGPARRRPTTTWMTRRCSAGTTSPTLPATGTSAANPNGSPPGSAASTRPLWDDPPRGDGHAEHR